MIRRAAIPVLLTFLTLLAFRGFLTTDIIYTTWDFAFPTTLPQVEMQLSRSLSIITEQYSLGYADNQNPVSFYFWLYVYPLMLIGAQHTAKIVIMLSVLLSGVFMYRFLRYLDLSRFASVLGSVYFMFNPFTYSRIVAGHYQAVAGVPFAVAFLHLLLVWLGKPYLSFQYLLLLCLTFVLATFHPMMIGVVGVLTATVAAGEVVWRRRWHLLPRLAVLGGCLVLISAHWLTPMAGNIIRQKPFFRGDLTIAEEQGSRVEKARGSANPIIYPILFYNRSGLDTEYAYPVYSPAVWIAAQLFLLGGVVVTLRLRRKQRHLGTVVGIFGIGIILTSGLGNPLGRLAYGILSHLGPLFFEFSNSNRFLPVAITGGSVLIAYGLHGIRLPGGRVRRFITAACVVAVALRVSAYFDNSLFRKQNDLSTPFAYFLTPYGADQQYIMSLLNERDVYRKGLAPPFQIAPVATGQFNYGTQAGTAPINDFFNGYSSANPFQHFMLSLLATTPPVTDRAGTLLGLANVSRIYFPHYSAYFYFLTFGQYASASSSETLYASESSLEKTLSGQSDLTLSRELSREGVIDVYTNRAVLPRVYGIRRLYLVAGNYDALMPIASRGLVNIADSSVSFARSLVPADMSGITDIILAADGREQLLYRFLDVGFAPDIMREPSRQIRNYFRGELALAAIPGKRKGIALDPGDYILRTPQGVHPNDVALLSVHPASDAVLTLNGHSLCGSVATCAGSLRFTFPQDTAMATLSVTAGRVYITDLFIVPPSALAQAETELSAMLGTKSVATLTDSSVPTATAAGQSAVTFRKLHAAAYRIEVPAGVPAVYFSQQYDDDWWIEGHPDIRPLPAGAEGMVFPLGGVHGTLTLTHRVQEFVRLGYCITLSTWFILCCLAFITGRKRYG